MFTFGKITKIEVLETFEIGEEILLASQSAQSRNEQNLFLGFVHPIVADRHLCQCGRVRGKGRGREGEGEGRSQLLGGR